VSRQYFPERPGGISVPLQLAKASNMKKRPLILVTNDDGINAPGIKALVEIASQFGEVIVVAPDSPNRARGTPSPLQNRSDSNR
jgi:5'-nucleotidase